MTRNAASPKAQALARRGAHVVEATLTDEGSLRRAFDGAYGTDTAKNKHHKPHGSATPPRTSTVASPSPSVPTAPP